MIERNIHNNTKLGTMFATRLLIFKLTSFGGGRAVSEVTYTIAKSSIKRSSQG